MLLKKPLFYALCALLILSGVVAYQAHRLRVLRGEIATTQALLVACQQQNTALRKALSDNIHTITHIAREDSLNAPAIGVSPYLPDFDELRANRRRLGLPER